MGTRNANSREVEKALSRQEVAQRVIRLPWRASFMPQPGMLFDVWHDGQPWAARVRSEPCCCPHPGGWHRHRYVECGELHAGLRWEVGARIVFRMDGGRIVVSGDLCP